MNMVILEQIKDLRSRLDTLFSCLGIADKEAQAAALEQRTQAADFWDDPKAAEGVLKQISSLKLWINAFNSAKGAVEDLEVLAELDPEGEDIDKQFLVAQSEVEDLELKNMLGAEGDRLGAVLTINSGAGGTEAND